MILIISIVLAALILVLLVRMNSEVQKNATATAKNDQDANIQLDSRNENKSPDVDSLKKSSLKKNISVDHFITALNSDNVSVIAKKFPEDLKNLIESEPDMRDLFNNYLIKQIQRDNDGLVDFLVRLGIISDDYAISLEKGTPKSILLHAIHSKARKVALTLITNGSGFSESKGSAALLTAASVDLPSVVDSLLQKGADPNAQDERKITALHRASSSESAESMKMLLACGADPNSVNDNSAFPLDRACAGPYPASIRELLMSGAIRSPFKADPSIVKFAHDQILQIMIDCVEGKENIRNLVDLLPFISTCSLAEVSEINTNFNLWEASKAGKSKRPFGKKSASIIFESPSILFASINPDDRSRSLSDPLVVEQLNISNLTSGVLECMIFREATSFGSCVKASFPVPTDPIKIRVDKLSQSNVEIKLDSTLKIIETALFLAVYSDHEKRSSFRWAKVTESSLPVPTRTLYIINSQLSKA